MRTERSHGEHRRRRGVATAIAGLSLFVGAVTTGCSTHDVPVSHPCTTVEGGKVVAVENRGAIALAKVGLTPKGLKAQEKCK